MNFLQVNDLCKSYGTGENRVAALDHVSLTIEKGEFVSIIGSSGSGKSTLLHALAGVDRPTSGQVLLDGQDVYAQNPEQLAIFRRRQVGLIYQFHNLIPTLDVVENITLPVLLDHRRVNRQRLEELLDLLGLAERRTHLPRAHECPRRHAGRRADGCAGQPQRAGDHPPAEAKPRKIPPDVDYRHP